MDAWIEFARGPLFLFAFTFMLLGMVRHFLLTGFEMWRAMRRAGDKSLPKGQVFINTVKWLFPLSKMGNRFFYSLTSIVFHVAILVVPIFLAGHIALWSRGIGLAWPAIPNGVADVLTIVANVTAHALVLQRLAAKATRKLSRLQDYIMPLLVALPFVTGLFAMHPSISPFSYKANLLLHVLSGNLIFILMPLTKLSHAVLMPSVQAVSEIGWHFPPDAGSRLAADLGKEGESI